MATSEEHGSQFEHNLEVAQRLAAAGDYDWAVIALFYSSLHLVQMYLVSCGVRVQSHVQRDREAWTRPELRSVLADYRTLRNHSEHARYECRRFSREEFEAIRNGTFNMVTTHVQSLLGR